MKNLIRKILVESAKEKFINTILSRIKPPYFKNLKKFGTDDKEIEIISKMLFGEGVTMVNDLSSGNYNILDDEGNEIYIENSGGGWVKRQYDDRNNKIYYEDSRGKWIKWEYDDRDNLIHYEDNSGDQHTWEYDEKGRIIYYENSDGVWQKLEYGDKDEIIYNETSTRGVIVDKR